MYSTIKIEKNNDANVILSTFYCSFQNDAKQNNCKSDVFFKEEKSHNSSVSCFCFPVACCTI